MEHPGKLIARNKIEDETEGLDLDGDTLEQISLFMGSEKQEVMYRKENQGQSWGSTSLTSTRKEEMEKLKIKIQDHKNQANPSKSGNVKMGNAMETADTLELPLVNQKCQGWIQCQDWIKSELETAKVCIFFFFFNKWIPNEKRKLQ